jgi:hypothetical protein
MNFDKEIVIQAQFDTAEIFIAGYKNGPIRAKVKKAGKYGIINHKGMFIVPPRYDSIGNFMSTSDGHFAKAKREGKLVYVNDKGKEFKQPKGKPIFICGTGMDSHCVLWKKQEQAPNKQDSLGVRTYFRNKNGRLKYDTIFLPLDSIVNFSHSKILFRKDHKVAFAVISLPHISIRAWIPTLHFIYDDVQPFPCFEGDAFNSNLPTLKCKIGEEWGLVKVNSLGQQKIITPFKYRSIIKAINQYYFLVEYEKGQIGVIHYRHQRLTEFWQ